MALAHERPPRKPRGGTEGARARVHSHAILHWLYTATYTAFKRFTLVLHLLYTHAKGAAKDLGAIEVVDREDCACVSVSASEHTHIHTHRLSFLKRARARSLK